MTLCLYVAHVFQEREFAVALLRRLKSSPWWTVMMIPQPWAMLKTVYFSIIGHSLLLIQEGSKLPPYSALYGSTRVKFLGCGSSILLPNRLACLLSRAIKSNNDERELNGQNLKSAFTVE